MGLSQDNAPTRRFRDRAGKRLAAEAKVKQPQRKLLVRDCIRSFQRLISAGTAGSVRRTALTESVASVCRSINALARVGCEIEARFIAELRDRLLRDAPLPQHRPLIRAMDDAIARLAAVPWLAEASRSAQPIHVYFVRHAESSANLEKRLQGSRIQGTLTPNGYLQSQRTAEYLAASLSKSGLEGVMLVSSPMARALQTAKAIGEELVCPLLTNPDLAELDFGNWSGQYFAQLETNADYRDWMKDSWFNSPPDGESMFEVRTRMCQGLVPLLSAAMASNSALVLVTHFFPLLAVLTELIPGESIRPDNSSITALRFEDGRWHPTLCNYVAHLGCGATPPVQYV